MIRLLTCSAVMLINGFKFSTSRLSSHNKYSTSDAYFLEDS